MRIPQTLSFYLRFSVSNLLLLIFLKLRPLIGHKNQRSQVIVSSSRFSTSNSVIISAPPTLGADKRTRPTSSTLIPIIGKTANIERATILIIPSTADANCIVRSFTRVRWSRPFLYLLFMLVRVFEKSGCGNRTRTASRVGARSPCPAKTASKPRSRRNFRTPSMLVDTRTLIVAKFGHWGRSLCRGHIALTSSAASHIAVPLCNRATENNDIIERFPYTIHSGARSAPSYV